MFPWVGGGCRSRRVELRAEGLVKVLGGTRVLRGVEASFDGGALHVLEGANGAGKSTLLSLLGGRTAPSSGRVSWVGEQAVAVEGAGLRRVVGWLGHELGLYPDLTSAENVALHASLRGLEPRQAWLDGATALGVESFGERRVRELSRGQRQRVALVRALVGSPPVVLLDEPSTGLDSAAIDRLVNLLAMLRAQGRLVVLVTHDPAFRDRLEARRWRLAGGRLEAG